MDELEVRIDRAARAYNEAAAALASALIAQVRRQDPELVAKVDVALAHGERLLVAWECHPAEPAIWMAAIDDYQQMRRIVTIPAKQAQRAN